MDKSKTKETKKQPRSTHSLDNASQMNKVESAQASAISSDIQVDAYNENTKLEDVMDKVIHPVRKRIRREVLEELWAADKLNKDGYWYVKLTDVIKIIGE